jgi:hypothetical protein
MDALGQSALVVAITSLAFGFSVLAKNVRNLLFLSFAAVTTLISAWAFSFFFGKSLARARFLSISSFTQRASCSCQSFIYSIYGSGL